MSSSTQSQETPGQMRLQSSSSASSDDEEEFIDDEDDDNNQSSAASNNPLSASADNSKARSKNKKTLGRVKIEMAYINNKIRRYTTFSKRKTGIMKKAYELATLTGTEVMLLVASETGHVYTYATTKLQPMITSEAGKALIQTCLAKEEPIVEPVLDMTNNASTTLNNNDVIFVEENQRKKRANTSAEIPTIEVSTAQRPVKRAKLKSSDDVASMNKSKQVENSNSHVYLPPAAHSLPQTTTVALPLSCFINADLHHHQQQQQQQQPQQQQQTGQANGGGISPSFAVDLNSFKTNGMNIIFAPSSSSNSSQTASPSNLPLVLTFGNLSYPPS